MTSEIELQKESFEEVYSNYKKNPYWDSSESLARYLLDRRLNIGVEHLMKVADSSPSSWDVLVVCGGVGGEGTVLANMRFKSVTVSDFSKNALRVCEERDDRLETRILNAENLDLAKESFDLVVVQDGLHHLPRPVLGFTEIIRVAKKGAIVIEPHSGIVANLLGRVWEEVGDTVNYVFRWDKELVEQVTRSYILQAPCYIKTIRLWNHNEAMDKLGKLFGGGHAGLLVVKSCYFVLDLLFGRLGNMAVVLLLKNTLGR
jgi:ubiquinone/menaquinone biosynthesis C-methylase UbiE